MNYTETEITIKEIQKLFGIEEAVVRRAIFLLNDVLPKEHITNGSVIAFLRARYRPIQDERFSLLSGRLQNFLKRSGVKNTEELLSMTKEQLFSFQGFGETSWMEIEAFRKIVSSEEEKK